MFSLGLPFNKKNCFCQPTQVGIEFVWSFLLFPGGKWYSQHWGQNPWNGFDRAFFLAKTTHQKNASYAANSILHLKLTCFCHSLINGDDFPCIPIPSTIIKIKFTSYTLATQGRSMVAWRCSQVTDNKDVSIFDFLIKTLYVFVWDMSLTIMLCLSGQFQLHNKSTWKKKHSTVQWNLQELDTSSGKKHATLPFGLTTSLREGRSPSRQASHDFGEGTYWRIKDLRIYDLNWKPHPVFTNKRGGGTWWRWWRWRFWPEILRSGGF